MPRQYARKHGECGTRLYNIWAGIKQRCSNPRHRAYARYGGRGITVDQQWADDYVVFKTWAEGNGYESDLVLDRIDNSKGYNPDNCQWISLQRNSSKMHLDKATEIFGVGFYIGYLAAIKRMTM